MVDFFWLCMEPDVSQQQNWTFFIPVDEYVAWTQSSYTYDFRNIRQKVLESVLGQSKVYIGICRLYKEHFQMSQ